MEILWVSEDEAREEDEVGVREVVMEFPVQCLAHQPQGLFKDKSLADFFYKKVFNFAEMSIPFGLLYTCRCCFCRCSCNNF